MLSAYLKGGAFELPVFVCVLFVGVLLRNVLTLLNWHEVSDREVSLLGNVSLSLFLAMALMSLRLWDLANLALPIFVLLAAQTVAMALYAIFVTFRVMGSNYDAVGAGGRPLRFWSGATPPPLPTCRPSPSASALPTWRFWWCPWWAPSSSTSSTPW